MSIEREEVKQIVETAEMRIGASVARMEAGMDAFKELMQERDRSYRDEMTRLRAEMTEFRVEVRSDIKSLRRTIVVTGISAVLAIFFGISAVNSALLTHFQGGLEAGSRIAAEHEAMRQDLRQLSQAIEQRRQGDPPQPKK